MKSQVLSLYHMPWLSQIGLGIFLVFFLLMLLWVFNQQRKPVYQYLENLPLSEEE